MWPFTRIMCVSLKPSLRLDCCSKVGSLCYIYMYLIWFVLCWHAHIILTLQFNLLHSTISYTVHSNLCALTVRAISCYCRSGKDEIGEDFDKFFFGDKNNKRNVNHKREANNKKHGFLGKSARLKKRNDATSASDTRDYRQPRKGGGARTGARAGSGGSRMGKSARNAKKQKRS